MEITQTKVNVIELCEDYRDTGGEVDLLMADDVVRKLGIYPYVQMRDESFLNLRSFAPSQKLSAYEKQKRKCVGRKYKCKGYVINISEMRNDRIIPWRMAARQRRATCKCYVPITTQPRGEARKNGAIVFNGNTPESGSGSRGSNPLSSMR